MLGSSCHQDQKCRGPFSSMSNVRFFELVDYLTSYMSNWFTDDPTDAEMTDSYDGEAAAEAWRDEWRHLTERT